jgi:hypothetical protein
MDQVFIAAQTGQPARKLALRRQARNATRVHVLLASEFLTRIRETADNQREIELRTIFVDHRRVQAWDPAHGRGAVRAKA